MSVARIHRVKKSAKDQGNCGSCGKALPKGSAYIWWSPFFRSRFKAKRCMDARCYPKDSELDSSKASIVRAAVESQDVYSATTFADLLSMAEAVADAADEVKDEYDEANENMGGYNSQMEELSQAYDYIADELRNWSPEHDDDDEWESDEDRESALEEAKEDLDSKFNEIEYP